MENTIDQDGGSISSKLLNHKYKTTLNNDEMEYNPSDILFLSNNLDKKYEDAVNSDIIGVGIDVTLKAFYKLFYKCIYHLMMITIESNVNNINKPINKLVSLTDSNIQINDGLDENTISREQTLNSQFIKSSKYNNNNRVTKILKRTKSAKFLTEHCDTVYENIKKTTTDKKFKIKKGKFSKKGIIDFSSVNTNLNDVFITDGSIQKENTSGNHLKCILYNIRYNQIAFNYYLEKLINLYKNILNDRNGNVNNLIKVINRIDNVDKITTELDKYNLSKISEILKKQKILKDKANTVENLLTNDYNNVSSLYNDIMDYINNKNNDFNTIGINIKKANDIYQYLFIYFVYKTNKVIKPNFFKDRKKSNLTELNINNNKTDAFRLFLLLGSMPQCISILFGYINIYKNTLKELTDKTGINHLGGIKANVYNIRKVFSKLHKDKYSPGIYLNKILLANFIVNQIILKTIGYLLFDMNDQNNKYERTLKENYKLLLNEQKYFNIRKIRPRSDNIEDYQDAVKELLETNNILGLQNMTGDIFNIYGVMEFNNDIEREENINACFDNLYKYVIEMLLNNPIIIHKSSWRKSYKDLSQDIGSISKDIIQTLTNMIVGIELGIFDFTKNITFLSNYEIVYSSLPLYFENIIKHKLGINSDNKYLLSNSFYSDIKEDFNNIKISSDTSSVTSTEVSLMTLEEIINIRYADNVLLRKKNTNNNLAPRIKIKRQLKYTTKQGGGGVLKDIGVGIGKGIGHTFGNIGILAVIGLATATVPLNSVAWLPGLIFGQAKTYNTTNSILTGSFELFSKLNLALRKNIDDDLKNLEKFLKKNKPIIEDNDKDAILYNLLNGNNINLLYKIAFINTSKDDNATRNDRDIRESARNLLLYIINHKILFMCNRLQKLMYTINSISNINDYKTLYKITLTKAIIIMKLKQYVSDFKNIISKPFEENNNTSLISIEKFSENNIKYLFNFVCMSLNSYFDTRNNEINQDINNIINGNDPIFKKLLLLHKDFRKFINFNIDTYSKQEQQSDEYIQIYRTINERINLLLENTNCNFNNYIQDFNNYFDTVNYSDGPGFIILPSNIGNISYIINYFENIFQDPKYIDINPVLLYKFNFYIIYKYILKTINYNNNFIVNDSNKPNFIIFFKKILEQINYLITNKKDKPSQINTVKQFNIIFNDEIPNYELTICKYLTEYYAVIGFIKCIEYTFNSLTLKDKINKLINDEFKNDQQIIKDGIINNLNDIETFIITHQPDGNKQINQDIFGIKNNNIESIINNNNNIINDILNGIFNLQNLAAPDKAKFNNIFLIDIDIYTKLFMRNLLNYIKNNITSYYGVNPNIDNKELINYIKTVLIIIKKYLYDANQEINKIKPADSNNINNLDIYNLLNAGYKKINPANVNKNYNVPKNDVLPPYNIIPEKYYDHINIYNDPNLTNYLIPDPNAGAVGNNPSTDLNVNSSPDKFNFNLSHIIQFFQSEYIAYCNAISILTGGVCNITRDSYNDYNDSKHAGGVAAAPAAAPAAGAGIIAPAPVTPNNIYIPRDPVAAAGGGPPVYFNHPVDEYDIKEYNIYGPYNFDRAAPGNFTAKNYQAPVPNTESLYFVGKRYIFISKHNVDFDKAKEKHNEMYNYSVNIIDIILKSLSKILTENIKTEITPSDDDEDKLKIIDFMNKKYSYFTKDGYNILNNKLYPLCVLFNDIVNDDEKDFDSNKYSFDEALDINIFDRVINFYTGIEETINNMNNESGEHIKYMENILLYTKYFPSLDKIKFKYLDNANTVNDFDITQVNNNSIFDLYKEYKKKIMDFISEILNKPDILDKEKVIIYYMINYFNYYLKIDNSDYSEELFNMYKLFQENNVSSNDYKLLNASSDTTNSVINNFLLYYNEDKLNNIEIYSYNIIGGNIKKTKKFKKKKNSKLRKLSSKTKKKGKKYNKTFKN
jgi:hypothetical protein